MKNVKVSASCSKVHAKVFLLPPSEQILSAIKMFSLKNSASLLHRCNGLQTGRSEGDAFDMRGDERDAGGTRKMGYGNRVYPGCTLPTRPNVFFFILLRLLDIIYSA